MALKANKPIASRKLLESNNHFLRRGGTSGLKLLAKRDAIKKAINSSASPAKDYVLNRARFRAIFGKHERRIILMRILKKSRPDFVIDTHFSEQKLEQIVKNIAEK